MTKYILCDLKVELIKEWQKLFSRCTNVEIKFGGFFETKCMAVVSPANSFGDMRGGLDYYLSIFFDKETPQICKELNLDLLEAIKDYKTISKFYSRLDWTIEKKVKEKIRKDFGGKLPVGRAVLVETENPQIPYLISAPTMEKPENISKTDNIYQATKGIIRLAEKEKINLVLVPGLGTGTGRVKALDCARQMEKAFFEIYGLKTENYLKPTLKL